jgi:hypothetical protein
MLKRIENEAAEDTIETFSKLLTKASYNPEFSLTPGSSVLLKMYISIYYVKKVFVEITDKKTSIQYCR